MSMFTDYLYQESLNKAEGIVDKYGVLVVNTGKRTGRSPKDRYIVLDDRTQHSVQWNEVNQAMSPAHFKQLWNKAHDFFEKKDFYHHHFLAGQHPRFRLSVSARTEYAWHMLFLSHLLIENKDPSGPSWELWVAPTLNVDPTTDHVHSDGVIAINFSEQKILILGIAYAGEIKKSIFSVMNFLLPEHHVLSMHCAANQGASGDVALFFGLSGTGKTSLSADPKRLLIGDDEHGWSDDGVFNIENGCYAKCFGLSADQEPLIFEAIRAQAIVENVMLTEDRRMDFDNAALTLNMRAAYPLHHIYPRQTAEVSAHPTTLFMLSCDLFGVLPALSKLSPDQAILWFLLGYTTHMGSTEHGESGIRPTFSSCFGAPFFPRPPEVYARLLKEKIEKNKTEVFLVNTGYYGGSYQNKQGNRYPIVLTRKLIDYALSPRVHHEHYEEGPFGLQVPHISFESFPTLNPMKLWLEPELYMQSKKTLLTHIVDKIKQLNLSEAFKDALSTFGITP